jgi:hypothetical protein
MSTVNDLLDFLTRNVEFLNLYRTVNWYHFDNPICLVMLPWKEIVPRYEFRIFVSEGRLLACSQQKWYQVFNYSEKEMYNLVRAFEEVVEVQLKGVLPFEHAVMDVYFDEKFSRAFLIECNPYGSYGSSGASLFHWIRDQEIIEPLDPQESKTIRIRFLDHFNSKQPQLLTAEEEKHSQ